MQGPPVNLVLLGLLILFFGLQLRGRRQQPYSSWLLGWVLIFLSYAVWEVMPLRPGWYQGFEVIRVDLLTVGIASFLLSFLLRTTKFSSTLKLSGIFLGPLLLMMDLLLLGVTLLRTFEAVTVVGGTTAVMMVYRLVPPSWKRRRLLLIGMCVLTVVSVIVAIHTNPTRYIQEAVQAPVLLGVAVLYMASSRSRRSVRALGGIGFLLWAEFYIIQDLLPRPSYALQLVYQFWDLPKYFVGTAMILELFEASRVDVERLADRYKLLYENLNMLYESHPQPMWIYDARTRQMLSANAAAVKTYGYSLEELLTMQAESLELDQAQDTPEGVMDAIHSPIPVQPNSRRAMHRHKGGEVVSVIVVERDMLFEGKAARSVLAVDVTEQDKIHQELFHRANHDALTQLPNRELLADRVMQVLARSERDSRCAVLLTVDVDYFKQINDTYGHPVGDECLKLIASRLQSRIRQVDTLARTGGEEFTAIIGGLSRRQDAEKIAESLRRLFDEPLVLEGRTLQVSISIGGALFPEDGTSMDTLRKRSDAALYTAKRLGRNRCVLSSAELEQTTVKFADIRAN